MHKAGAVVLIALLAGGCVAERATTLPLAVDRAAVQHMAHTNSILEKRRIAAAACRDAGYVRRVGAWRQCMIALIARDIERTRERADRLVREAAKHHGVCLQRPTFRVARCIEI